MWRSPGARSCQSPHSEACRAASQLPMMHRSLWIIHGGPVPRQARQEERSRGAGERNVRRARKKRRREEGGTRGEREEGREGWGAYASRDQTLKRWYARSYRASDLRASTRSGIGCLWCHQLKGEVFNRIGAGGGEGIASPWRTRGMGGWRARKGRRPRMVYMLR